MRVELDDLLPLARFAFEPADRELIAAADAGDPAAECELALLFLLEGVDEEAVRWLERAAAKFYPEAMHQLGRCLLAGRGVAVDEAAGIGWIAKAAGRGHRVCERMSAWLADPARPAMAPAELEAALDAIEREVVLAALERTAGRGPTSQA